MHFVVIHVHLGGERGDQCAVIYLRQVAVLDILWLVLLSLFNLLEKEVINFDVFIVLEVLASFVQLFVVIEFKALHYGCSPRLDLLGGRTPLLHELFNDGFAFNLVHLVRHLSLVLIRM